MKEIIVNIWFSFFSSLINILSVEDIKSSLLNSDGYLLFVSAFNIVILTWVGIGCFRFSFVFIDGRFKVFIIRMSASPKRIHLFTFGSYMKLRMELFSNVLIRFFDFVFVLS